MDMEEKEHLNISTLQNLNKELKDSVNEWFRTQFTIDQFPDLVEAAKSNDISRQHYGIIGIRRLCANMDPPIDQLIDAEMVPRIVEFLRNDEEPHLQMESTWIMANFSTGNSTQVQTFVDLGGVHCLIKLLKSGVKETQENAMWTLGNIAADHDRFKDTIFKHGGLEAILDLIKTKANLEQKLGAVAVWGFKHLCRYVSQKSFAKMKPVIPVLCQIITQHNDDNVLSEAIITLGSLVATDSALAIDAKVEFHTSEVLIPKILQLLYDVDTNRKDRRDVSFFLLHLIKHHPFQSDQVINNHHFIDMLIKLAIRLAGELKSNIIQTLSILIKNANSAGASNLVDSGILDYFIFLLDSTDAKTLQIALEAIDSILSKGSDFLSRANQYLDILEDRGGVAKIENLQEHSDETVYHKALKILEKYFDLESLI